MAEVAHTQPPTQAWNPHSVHTSSTQTPYCTTQPTACRRAHPALSGPSEQIQHPGSAPASAAAAPIQLIPGHTFRCCHCHHVRPPPQQAPTDRPRTRVLPASALPGQHPNAETAQHTPRRHDRGRDCPCTRSTATTRSPAATAAQLPGMQRKREQQPSSCCLPPQHWAVYMRLLAAATMLSTVMPNFS